MRPDRDISLKTDHELMLAVSRGELDRMSDVYERRHRALFRFFFRITGRQATSEDLTHEVFLRMIRYRHTYTAVGGFEPWMYRIARNAMADHAKKRRHETPSSEDQFEVLESADPTPYEAAAKKQELALLHRALSRLPEEKRELLVLTRFQGLSHEEVGNILGCEVGAVKVRVYRAMKEMGRIYEDLLQEKAS